MNDATETIEERPHPSDTTAAEQEMHRRRFALGIVIAISLNIALLSGGAVIAGYIEKIMHPFFFKTDKIVYVRLDVTPSPEPSPKTSAKAK